MFNKRHLLGFAILIFVFGVIAGLMAGGVVAQGFPQPAIPVTSPASGDQLPIDFQTLVGRGADHAPLALQSSLGQLPFRAHLPDYLPQGLKLYRSTAQVIGTDGKYGNLDLYYTGTGTPAERIDLHIYQTNQSLESKKSEKVAEAKSMQIRADVWSYRLLAYPQPDGTTFKLHNLSRTLDDGVYIDLDIRVGTAPEATLAELTKVVLSLR